MKPFQLLLKSSAVLVFILCFVCADAQSLRIQERGDSQLRIAGERSVTNTTNTNFTINPNIEESDTQSTFVLLQNKLNHLLGKSDTQNGQQIIQMIITDYNLPSSGLGSLTEQQNASVQHFVQAFVPRDHMEKTLLDIYKKLKSETE